MLLLLRKAEDLKNHVSCLKAGCDLGTLGLHWVSMLALPPPFYSRGINDWRCVCNGREAIASHCESEKFTRETGDIKLS